MKYMCFPIFNNNKNYIFLKLLLFFDNKAIHIKINGYFFFAKTTKLDFAILAFTLSANKYIIPWKNCINLKLHNKIKINQKKGIYAQNSENKKCVPRIMNPTYCHQII
ncbi:hypothetical protein BpHYR1_029004 [Brachionus plicatilis]|uniref:Uncharacterized protein n=1 Tax=Brachionus plicatilis TaxID=10195 RepID=A0A3M7SW77_BRAPC|nr:hypothetical protein BpHYR1_029004 [Brachionus plicatilis]